MGMAHLLWTALSYISGQSGQNCQQQSSRDNTLWMEIHVRGGGGVYVYVCVLSHFSHVPLFATLWTEARQAPLWDFPGKNTGVGCYALLQGIFPTQGWNLYLLHLLLWQVGFLRLAPPGKPMYVYRYVCVCVCVCVCVYSFCAIFCIEAHTVLYFSICIVRFVMNIWVNF